jgi:hypothetical protein
MSKLELPAEITSLCGGAVKPRYEGGMDRVTFLTYLILDRDMDTTY